MLFFMHLCLQLTENTIKNVKHINSVVTIISNSQPCVPVVLLRETPVSPPSQQLQSCVVLKYGVVNIKKREGPEVVKMEKKMLYIQVESSPGTSRNRIRS